MKIFTRLPLRTIRGRYEDKYHDGNISAIEDPAVRRHNYLVRHYDMSLKDYEAMFDAQNGKCAVCGKRSLKTLAVDHDHETGKVRALLCFKCNTGLGQFGDDSSQLLEAAAYLEKHSEELDAR